MAGGKSGFDNLCGATYLALETSPTHCGWDVGFQMGSGIQDPYFVIHGLVEVSVYMHTQGRLLWQVTKKQRTILGVLGAGIMSDGLYAFIPTLFLACVAVGGSIQGYPIIGSFFIRYDIPVGEHDTSWDIGFRWIIIRQ